MFYDFDFHTPTEVVFGKDRIKELGTLLKKYGATKVLVHYGKNSVKRSGLLDMVKSILNQEGIPFVELGGVVPNPRLSMVLKGIELGKKENIDFILALGGGSVIDSSKSIGYGLADKENGNVWDFFEGKRTVKGCLPVATVLTIPAAGSEMSSSCVITNDIDGWYKAGSGSPYARCRFAIMDPQYTFTLPPYQTMSGSTDILMHTLERYFSAEKTNADITEQIAEALLRSVMKNALILRDDPNNYDARASIMWSSSLSHNDLTNCGFPNRGDWASHQLEHELGGMYDVAHGAGLAAVWGSWAEYCAAKKPSRFAQLGKGVFNINPEDNKNGQKTIDAFENFFKEIKMPTNLHKLGIKPDQKDIEKLALKCTHNKTRTIGAYIVLSYEDILKIYTKAIDY